jgi:hypothetical protein
MFKILRGLGSQALSCGCLVGVYETYAAETVAVIDVKGVGCGNGAHRVDSSVEYDPARSSDSAQPPSTMPTMNR